MDAALTFGASSSPGIFDRIAELVLRMALHMAKLSRDKAIRQLDDNVLIGPEEEVVTGYEAYKSLAKTIGVRVAPEERDKAFGPQTYGAVLGFVFNIKDWNWTMDHDKAAKICRLLFRIVEDGQISQGELQTLVGKIGFYHPLFQGAKFERTFFLNAVDLSKPKSSLVTITPGLVSQARWWATTIAATLDVNMTLPDPRGWFPAHVLNIYPDASGGLNAAGSGFGAVVWSQPQVYVAHFWPQCIRQNVVINPGPGFEEQRLAHHTMFLESVAVISGLLAAPELIRNVPVAIHCDNSGVVAGFLKGHSSESLAWTVLKAVRDIAQAFNCPVEIRKVTRCSDKGSLAADLLSKAELEQARAIMDCPASGPGFLSRTLLHWLEKPTVSRVLGYAILEELRQMGIKSLRSYVEDEEEINKLVKVSVFS